MTLSASGKINFSQIGSEGQIALLSPVDFNNLNLRKLVNKKILKSPISAQDFYGKTWGIGPGFADTEFVAQLDQPTALVITSNKVAAPADSYLAIFCSYPAQYRIDGGVWTDKSILGSVVKDSSVEIQLTTAATFGTDCSVTVKFGPSLTKIFEVSTGVENRIYVYLDVYGNRTLAGGTGSDKYDVVQSAAAISAKLTPTVGKIYTDVAAFTDTDVTVNAAAGVSEVSGNTTGYRQYIRSYITCIASETISFTTLSVQDAGEILSAQSILGPQLLINGVHKKIKLTANCSFGWGFTYFNSEVKYSLQAV